MRVLPENPRRAVRGARGVVCQLWTARPPHQQQQWNNGDDDDDVITIFRAPLSSPSGRNHCQVTANDDTTYATTIVEVKVRLTARGGCWLRLTGGTPGKRPKEVERPEGVEGMTAHTVPFSEIWDDAVGALKSYAESGAARPSGGR